MRSLSFVIAALTLMASGALAETKGPVPEIRPVLGAYVPTGDQRDILQDAALVGIQGAVEVAQSLHFVGTFAWSMSSDPRFLVNDGVNLLQYDGGIEVFRTAALGPRWMIRPFLGAGAGGRTFDYSNRDGKAQTYATGYGAAGAELQTGRFAIRLEARNYVYRFKGLTGNDEAKTRDDLTFVLGAAFHWW